MSPESIVIIDVSGCCGPSLDPSGFPELSSLDPHAQRNEITHNANEAFRMVGAACNERA
jgi:hypothetical protein